MIFHRRGAFTRRIIDAIISIALRLFFRRIETSHAERVPSTGALVFVLNHPNGLIDPALVFVALPRRISFLAKSTLFRLPVIGSLMRAVEALPLYRRIDAGEDTAQNRRTFEACHDLLRRGGSIALFPEGVSHNAPQLLPVKTGAARIALGALSVGSDEEASAPLRTLGIIPVGLYYTSKTTFRSEALLRFGAKIDVHAVALDDAGEPPRDAVRQLSTRIEDALREVTLNVADDAALETVGKTEQLFSSLYESLNIRLSLSDELDARRRFAADLARLGAESPARIARLKQRLNRYEENLRSIGIAPENLSVSTHSRWYVFRHFLLRTALLLFLAPFALVGALVHLPAYLASTLFARRFRTHGADDIVSTVKILAAIVLMPLTWIVVAASVYIVAGWRAALVAFPAVIACGYAAMRSIEEAYDVRGWFKAALVLLGRRTLFIRLLLERRALHDELLALGTSDAKK